MSTASSSKKRKVGASDVSYRRYNTTDDTIVVEHVNPTRFRRPKLICRYDSYQDFVEAVKKEFNLPADSPIALFNDQLPAYRGTMVEVTDDAFKRVIRLADNLLWEEAILEDTQVQPDPRNCDGSRPGVVFDTKEAYETVSAALKRGPDEVLVRTLTGKTMKFNAHLSETVSALKMRVYAREGIPVDQQRLMFGATQLDGDKKLNDYNITRGSTIYLVLKLSGGKPVIHLFSPEELEAKVFLSLDSAQWTSTVRYPEPVISQGPTHELLHWNVRTRSDGNLTVILPTSEEVEVDSLFWEAETVALPRLLQSEATNGIVGETFFPTTPRIDPLDAVLLPIEEIPLYLDRALKALTLHIGARTFFITYWLPSLLKHKFIALRFLPQAAYERAARLDIDPKPDVVTRVFMLFRGVDAEEALQTEKWQSAMERGKLDSTVSLWREVVGIDVEKATDENLFRVLEWGGMEVK